MKKENIERSKREKYPLISYHELPEYMKDNEFILNYYRANWPLKEAFFSIFSWHNETLNVWTHLIGFILFMVLTIANAEHISQLADFMTMFIRRPKMKEIRVDFSAKNPLNGQVKIRACTCRQILLCFTNEEDYYTILYKKSLFVAGAVMLISWSPDFHHEVIATKMAQRLGIHAMTL